MLLFLSLLIMASALCHSILARANTQWCFAASLILAQCKLFAKLDGDVLWLFDYIVCTCIGVPLYGIPTAINFANMRHYTVLSLFLWGFCISFCSGFVISCSLISIFLVFCFLRLMLSSIFGFRPLPWCSLLHWHNAPYYAFLGDSRGGNKSMTMGDPVLAVLRMLDKWVTSRLQHRLSLSVEIYRSLSIVHRAGSVLKFQSQSYLKRRCSGLIFSSMPFRKVVSWCKASSSIWAEISSLLL